MFHKYICTITESDEYEGCHTGEVWSVTRPPWSVVTRVEAVSGCGTLTRMITTFFGLLRLRSALTAHSGSQQSLDRSFSPSHEDTVSGPGPAHNLQVPQYCQYDPHV